MTEKTLEELEALENETWVARYPSEAEAWAARYNAWVAVRKEKQAREDGSNNLNGNKDD